MNIITYENFKPENLVLSVENKKYLYTNETYQFKKIMIKYIYDNGKEDDVYVHIPEVHSFGIKTFDNNDQQLPSHSFSFCMNVKPSLEDSIDDQLAKEMTDGTIKIFDDIHKSIKQFLKLDHVIKKLGKSSNKGWAGIVENLKSFMSVQIDKETEEPIEGSSPTLFVKLKMENTKTNPAIKTVFKQYNNETGDLDEIPANIVAEKYQGCRCTATGVIHVESIFIPKMNNISVQFKLYEVLITEILKTNVNRLVIPKRLQKINKMYESDDEDEKFMSFVESETKEVSRV